MNIDNWFKTILQSALSGDNEANQEAFNSYTEVITNTPEELALVHFRTLSAAKSEQERTLTLILLGRYFSILKTNQILLSDEVSKEVQNLIISIYQLENLTPKDFNILSNDIFLSARYFRDKWEQLPELLYELLISPNKIISASIASCLSDCMYNQIIDVEQSFDKIFEFVQNILSTLEIDKTNLQYLSSILQLFYSLANFSAYKPSEIYIPIFNELPNILRLSQHDTSIFNSFCTHVKFNQEIFESSLDAYFELFIEILSNPDFSSLKHACSIALNNLISSSPLTFLDRANDIFDILTQLIDQNEISYEISDLSNEYGAKDFFAEHAFDYLKNNAPNPKAYIAFGSSFDGIKNHFINSNLSEQLLSLFEPGFSSQDPFTRFVSFNSFMIIIADIVDNEEWHQCSRNIVEKTLNAITSENNNDSLLKEIQLLEELLKKFSLYFSEIIEDIILLLDQLTDSCSPIEFQNELFQCYKYISSSYKEKFLPLSENFGSKMMNYINNPIENEDLFFNSIEILSDFKESLPQELFNDLLQSTFQFLTSVVFDENGNVNEEFSLSDDNRLKIINFFLYCLQKEIIDDSFELIETIVKISFNTASKEIIREIVDRNSDLEFMINCHIFLCSQGFLIIGKDQFILIQNSIKILVLIFKSNEQLLQKYNEDIIKLTNILLREPAFTFNTILNDIYDLMKFDFMFNSNEEDLKEILVLSLRSTINSENSEYEKYDYGNYSECLLDLVKIIGKRFSDDPSEQMIIFIQQFLNILNFVYSYLDAFSKMCKLKSMFIQDKIYYLNHEKAKIDIALAYREFFKSFPIIAALNFSQIKSLIDDDDNIIKSIVFSDFIHFCPQEDDSIFISTFQYFNNKLDDDEIFFDSIYALAIILVPQRFSHELMKNFLIEVSSKLSNSRNDIKNIIPFLFLQAFQNYSSSFDLFDQFWELFDDDICSLPYYCYFYLDKSLNFLVENFQNQIPDEKKSTLQSVIESIKHH